MRTTTTIDKNYEGLELKDGVYHYNDRVIFSSYVNEKVAWLAYGDFIRFALSNTNGDVRFGYYVDGEPFCSGSFGELRYSGFLKHGC